MKEQGVTKVYLSKFSSLKEVVKFFHLPPEEQAYYASSRLRYSCGGYLRFVDNEDRVGVSKVQMAFKRFPGKKPYLAHSASAFAFYDKKTKKFRHKNLPNLVRCLLGNSEIIKNTPLINFVPASVEEIDNIKSIKLLVPPRGAKEERKNEYWTLNMKINFVEDILSSARVMKGIITGKVTTLKQAIKIRCNFPCGRMNLKQAMLVYRAFGETGLKFYPYIATSVTGLVSAAQRRIETPSDQYDNTYNGVPFRSGDPGIQGMMADLIEMSTNLNRKVDFGWSDRRIKEEHDGLTEIIVCYKQASMKKMAVTYDIPFPSIPQVELIRSNHRLLRESVTMNHCVGTSSSYFKAMLRGKIIICHIEYEGQPITVQYGITYEKEKPTVKIGQCSLKFNKRLGPKAMDHVKVVKKIIEKSKFMGNFPFPDEYIKEHSNNYDLVVEPEPYEMPF